MIMAMNGLGTLSANTFFRTKITLSEPTMSKEETLNGLLDYIVIGGCTGMNDLYRKFLYSAIGYLS